jgi:type IV pilus assembly protein PilC
MPTFRCKITTSGGSIEEKTLIADSKDSLLKQLESEGKFALDIQKSGGLSTLFENVKSKRKRFKTKDFFSFNQEFLVLIKAGLPIVAALDSITEKDDESELNKLLKDMQKANPYQGLLVNMRTFFRTFIFLLFKPARKAAT